MRNRRSTRCGIAALTLITLAGCSGIGSGDSGLFRKSRNPQEQQPDNPYAGADIYGERGAQPQRQSSILDLFENKDDPNTTVEVNKYIWNATLQILDFLPIESADPFSGVIVTGYGTPPGGGRAYKATVLVQDPALDARSLKLSLSTRSGPVSPATARAIEDAILTRARQLRIRDGKL